MSDHEQYDPSLADAAARMALHANVPDNIHSLVGVLGLAPQTATVRSMHDSNVLKQALVAFFYDRDNAIYRQFIEKLRNPQVTVHVLMENDSLQGRVVVQLFEEYPPKAGSAEMAPFATMCTTLDDVRTCRALANMDEQLLLVIGAKDIDQAHTYVLKTINSNLYRVVASAPSPEHLRKKMFNMEVDNVSR